MLFVGRAVCYGPFSREWRFCCFSRLWLVTCWFDVFTESASWGAVTEWAGPVAVCVWRFGCGDGGFYSDQPLINNQHPAVSSPPASSTSAGKSANVKLLGQEGSVGAGKTQTHSPRGFLFVFLYQWHMEEKKKHPCLQLDAANHFLKATNPPPNGKQIRITTVSITEAGVTVRPLESHHHSIYTTRYVLNWVSIRWQWLLLGVAWGWSFIILLVQRDKWEAICQP